MKAIIKEFFGIGGYTDRLRGAFQDLAHLLQIQGPVLAAARAAAFPLQHTAYHHTARGVLTREGQGGGARFRVYLRYARRYSRQLRRGTELQRLPRFEF